MSEQKEWFKDYYFLGLLILIIIYIITRIKFLFTGSMWPDEALYAWYGLNLLRNPVFILSSEFWSYHPPLFSIIIAFFNIFLNKEVAARIVSPLFGLAGIILIYYLGKELKNKLVGLLAAIMLTFNHLFWFFNDRILLDGPLTTMFIATAYTLLRYAKEKTVKNLIIFIIILFLTFLIKRVSVAILPFVIIYLVYTYWDKLKKNKYLLASIIIIILLIITILYLVKFEIFRINVHEFINNIFSLETLKSILEVKLVFLVTWYIMPFLILGMIFLIIYRHHDYFFPFLFILSIIGMRVLAQSAGLPRYILPALPGILLLAALAIDELKELIIEMSNIRIPNLVFIIIVLLLCIPIYNQGDQLNLYKSYTYTGFREAGEFIKNNIPEQTTIYVGSGRATRFYSERTNLENLPRTIQELKQLRTGAYLEVDAWEYLQPDYVYPFSNEKFQQLDSLGFKPVKIIKKEYMTSKGLKKIPVVIIYQRTGLE